MTLDSHQHFWKYDPREYSWIAEPMAVLKRDFLPEDLAREQARVQFDGSIAVQARQTLEETRWLLELARTNQRIRAVVGWVDLRSPSVANDLEHFCADPKFVGVFKSYIDKHCLDNDLWKFPIECQDHGANLFEVPRRSTDQQTVRIRFCLDDYLQLY